MDGHSGHGVDMHLEPFTLGRGLSFTGEPFFLTASLIALVLYLAGVWHLHRRGDGWPAGRVVAFVLGIATVIVAMCTGLNDYGMVMFSVHMVQHMIISMLSPILILLGAPVTLALRALPAGHKGSRGPRELLVALLHSRYMRVITHPGFTIPMFIASLYALYFTPLFDFLMGSKAGHIAMMVHFFATGLVFFWPIMGADPGPHRPSHLMRIFELLVGMPFHAFFGVALMMSSSVLVSTFAHPPASLGVNPLSDQVAAGGIAWAFSEIPTVVVLLAVVFQWWQSEERSARRSDRAADRYGDADLEAYNAYLAALDARSRRG